MELDGEAELQHGAAMADAAQVLIRPRVGSNELGNGTACVLSRRGRSREVEARGNGSETAVGRQHSSGDGERQLRLLGSAVHSVHGRGKGNGEAKANLASHSATWALKRRWWSSARRVATTTSRPAVL